MVAILCSLFANNAAAEFDAQRLSSHGFFVVSRGMPLAQVLHELSESYGVPVTVSAAVTGVFSGQIHEASGLKALEDLARDYGLAWYLSGGVVYVYKTREIKEVIVTPTWLSARSLLNDLRSASVFSSPYCRASVLGNLNSIDVTGVPQCIDRVNELVRSLDVDARKSAQDEEAVEVFPLRYASAIDGTYTYRDQQVSVPGVVTELREMSKSRTLPIANPANSGAQLPPLPVSTDMEFGGGQLPLFSADVRRNAVIVRDRKANMILYRRLIPQLDKKPVQIEISVDIIDVDAGNLSSLGVDISGAAKIYGNGISLNGSNFDPSSFSTLLDNSVGFLVRINALVQSAKAKILSRPSVVTLDNVQAVLDRNVTFYTKLQGKNVAKLQSVAAGSLLRVTPRLVTNNGVNEIVLTLDIQDGQQQTQSQNVDSLPQVQNSSIATQAILKPGQSLLIGGFVQKEDVSGERRIPLLSDIPILGQLFVSRSTGGQSVVRLFLITARPLLIPGDSMNDVPVSIDQPLSSEEAAYSGEVALYPPLPPSDRTKAGR
ncbi:EscC/YscC/HrcC family type III secretion system outer membrane ring protein [Burkholderia sp. Bp8986]|uniref:EscC/YscC/HrcC family type III secretion system outer membrane ring protein n=1 Tax=Burkholderia sp. Bp8986 TaxID=2184550 RepID=UPI0021AB9788|nr:EscC/YscC/HrcC family type III secretion system outer membrane ring protein [Burkholderia sp. Bp8986]